MAAVALWERQHGRFSQEEMAFGMSGIVYHAVILLGADRNERLVRASGREVSVVVV